MITVRQAEYRAYLASPVWKAKRAEALAHHGCICNRCGDWGNDVHHKTYERVGGDELMEDLEILCRECHEAHHEAERCATREKGIRMIHRRAIYEKLTHKHVKILHEEFPKVSNIFMELNYGSTQFADRAANLLGCDYAWGKIPKKKRSRIRDCSHVDPEDFVTQSLHIEELGWDQPERKKKSLENIEKVVQFLVILEKYRQRP